MVISELLTEAYCDGVVDYAIAREADSDYFEFDDDRDDYNDGDDNEEEVKLPHPCNPRDPTFIGPGL